MARKDKTPARDEIRSASEYYKLNTKAVDDLVNADESNSPEVSEEELKKYRTRHRLEFSDSLKPLLLKAWFAGSVCFFFFWGLGIYLADFLDQFVVLAIAQGVITDLLVNNILRFWEKTPGGNDRWMMLPRRSFAAFFLNILYAFLVLFLVYLLYNAINSVLVRLTGAADSVPLGVGPILFGVFYTAFDQLFIGMKRLLLRIVADAKKNALRR